MPIETGKSAGTLMRENAAIAPIRARCAALARLQQSFADVLPPGLKGSCRVATMEGSTLVIAVANGAAAARLKQMLPRVLQALRGTGIDPAASPSDPQPATLSGKNKIKEQQVTAISVLVQPNFREVNPPRPRHENRSALPAAGRSELLEKLADSPLKDALMRIKTSSERTPT
jgi:hypothetical protein